MNYKKSGWVFFLMVVISIALSLLLGMERFDLIMNEWSILILSELIIVVPCFLGFLFSKEQFCNVFAIHKIRFVSIFFCAFYAMLLTPLISTCNAISLFFTDNAAQQILDSMNGLPFWVIALFAAVIAPVCEECAFRGILYTGFRRSGSALRAIILTALMFGLFHMNLNQMIYAFVLGIFFALLREATGSVWPSIIGHVTINGGSVLLLLLEQEQEIVEAESELELTNEMLLVTVGVMGIIAFFTTAIAFAILVLIAKMEYGEVALKNVLAQRKTERGRVLSLSLICAMLACVLIIAYGIFAF